MGLRGVVLAVFVCAVAALLLPGFARADNHLHQVLGKLEPVGATSAGPLPVMPGAATPFDNSVVNAPPIPGAMTYHHGVVIHSAHVHAIYWSPNGDGGYRPGYRSLIERYIADVGHDSGTSSNVFGSDTQYSDTAAHIAYNFSSDASTLDTDPYPSDARTYPRDGCPATPPPYGGVGPIGAGTPAACLTDTEIVDEVESLAAANHWQTGFDTQYVIFLPYGVDECIDWARGNPCFESDFCAYHSWDGLNTTPNLVYAVEPESEMGDPNCWPQSMWGPNNNDADVTISSLSHELNEMITDPAAGGWYDANGNENGDKCAYNYGAVLGAGPYNQYINGHPYLTQREWSNALNGCYEIGPPKITSVTPLTSPANTWITLTGENLYSAYPDDLPVLMNGHPAWATGSYDGKQVNVTVPDVAGTAGHITVKALTGTAVSSQVFGMQPVLDSISESEGFAGDAITLTGTGFYGVTRVSFNGVPGTLRSVATNGTSLVAVVPAAATSGDVVVSTGAGSTVAVHTFTVDPKVTLVSPVAVAGLATVTVTGTGLAGATDVSFNGDSSPQIVSSTATSVVAKVPVDATNGPITVTTGAGTSAPSATVVKPLPELTSVTGDPAQAGDIVVFNGYDLTPTTAAPTVKLGAVELTPGGVTPTSFSITLPDGALTGPLTVTTPNGSATSTLHVRPTISGAPSPSDGAAGTVVTLTGAAFTGTSRVTVGGVGAAFAIVDYHDLHVTIPPAAVSGPIAVTNAGGTTSSTSFTVDPKVVAVAPAAAAGLANVTITGTGLAGATQVSFNGDPSPQIVSNTATSVVAQVPVDAPNGPIIVTTAAGISDPSSAIFKPLPKLTDITGDPAQVGDTVTVNGYDLTPTDVSPTVKLGTVALTPGSLTATSLTATIPDGAASGSIAVTTANGTATATLHVRPTISAAPSPGDGAAGTLVTLTGAAFTGTSRVTVGGVSATFAIVDYHHLHVTIPAGAVSGPIAVTNAGGTTNSTSFAVDAKIVTVAPAAAAGLTNVTITGTGLAGATQVAFNGEPSPQVVSSTATSVVAQVPVDATNGPITVTTPAGTSAPSSAVFKPLPKLTDITGDPGQVGDTVTVNGYDLTPTGASPTVKLGTAVLAPSAVTATSFSVTMPDGALTGPLTVTTPNGSATTTLHLRPTISGAPSPSDGAAGTVVTLTGAAFTGTSRVTVGGVSATFAIVDYHHLHVTIPAGAVSGPIAVTNAGGTTNSTSFAVDAKIVTVAPAAAAGLTNVTITGTGLAGATQVAFNGEPSPQVVSSTATSVVAQVPVDATNGPITVTTPAGTSAPSSAVFKPLPKLGSITGDPGQVGDTVTVNGYDLTPTGAAPTVKLGTVALAPGSLTATSFTATIPDGAVSGSLTVATSNGTSTATLHVRPTIAGAPSPGDGAAGTVVTLTGAAFTGTSRVTVGGVSATFAIVDYHHLHVTIPAGAVSGPIAVTNAGGTTSSASFTVDPQVTSFSPAAATGLATVTITGTGLAGATDVSFNGDSSPQIVSSTATSVLAQVPLDATNGPITVTTPAGTSAPSSAVFKPLPKLGSITGDPGHVGDTVTVNGYDLTPTDAAPTVKLGAIALSPASVTPTSFSVTLPDGALTGPLTVTTPNGSATTTLHVEPTITDAPSPGDGAAGTVVTLTGTAFTATTKVTVGGISATFAIVDYHHLHVTIPAAAVSGPIVVTNAGGTATSSSFTVDPKITSLSPASGATGTALTIIGTGLAGATAVDFGGLTAVPTSSTANAVHVVVPDGAATGQITVHTASSSPATSPAPFTVTLSVTDLSPSIAKAGDLVKIVGTGLSGVTGVKFNGHSAGFVVTNSTQIWATVPDGGATGVVTVTEGAVTVNSPRTFTLLTLAGIAPSSAAPGGTVRITGTGFTGAEWVAFSGHPATSFTVDSDTQITATVPAGFGGGTGSVVVTANGGKTIAGDLTLFAITAWSTNHAAPGTQIDIYGSGFTGATSVSFNGRSTTPQVVDDGHLTATVPLDATDGTLTITGPGGTVTGGTFRIDRATLRLNEAAPNLTGGKALIELTAVTGGGVGGTTIAYNTGSGATTLATLPVVTVTAGQLIVLHVNSSGTNETHAQADCGDPSCYPNAWDEFAPGITLPFANLTLEVVSGIGTPEDGAAFVAGAAPGSGYAGALAALQAAGLWGPANCGGVACGDASTPTAAQVSVDWSGVGTDPSGNTVQRVGTDSPNDAANWTLAPGTIGSAN